MLLVVLRVSLGWRSVGHTCPFVTPVLLQLGAFRIDFDRQGSRGMETTERRGLSRPLLSFEVVRDGIRNVEKNGDCVGGPVTHD